MGRIVTEFKVGDIVQHTSAFCKNIGWVTNVPKNGLVVEPPELWWHCDPQLLKEAGIECATAERRECTDRMCGAPGGHDHLTRLPVSNPDLVWVQWCDREDVTLIHKKNIKITGEWEPN